MISLPILVSLALLPFTLAQSSDTALQVAAMEAHFKQSQIVPSLLASFDPTALLTLNYAGVGDVTPGQLLTKEQSAPTPVVTVTPVNSTVQLTGKYTIAMVDADVVGSDLSKGVNHHWLINGVDITDGKVTNASATAITAYAGPGPAAGSGPHRYVVIIYTQPESFKAPPALSQPVGVALFDLNAYAKDSGLGPIVAANYVTVEDGTATASIPATSSVISSTLVPSQPTTTGTGTKSGTATGAAGPTKTNGAVSLASFSPLGVVLAGIAIMIAA
ncbi:phosphatidylethanolamine-binding protein [Lyophyllum atratum]|nr:phosphatidylethanolamine-binding protein [Lyophyllum atratum]